MAGRKAIINGDDFGYSQGVNKGIIKAYQEGILTSTTVLANCITESTSIVEGSSQISKPKLGIGVHLNLTYGKPCRPNLWEDAMFARPYKGLDTEKEWQGSAWNTYFSTYNVEKVLEEFREQIRRTQTSFGAIDHLDSHHGVASYEPALTAYMELAKEFHLALRHTSHMSDHISNGGEFIVDPLFTQQSRTEGIHTVDRVIMHYFYKDADPEQSFIDSLHSIKEGEVVEYMFHPAIDAEQGEWRMKDLEILTSKRITEAVNSLEIDLTTYGESAY